MDIRMMPVSRKAIRRKKQKTGFTLTEIAIVLAIIGLVLGAIWAAASAVYTNMRTSKMRTELVAIVQNIRAMYGTVKTVDSAANMNGFQAQSGKALTYVQGNIFPPETLNLSAGASPTSTEDPWGGYMNIQAATYAVKNDSFQVSFDKVPQRSCIVLLTVGTLSERDPGLLGVSTADEGTVPAPALDTIMPVTASIAQGVYCTKAYQAIGFTFTLN